MEEHHTLESIKQGASITTLAYLQSTLAHGFGLTRWRLVPRRLAGRTHNVDSIGRTRIAYQPERVKDSPAILDKARLELASRPWAQSHLRLPLSTRLQLPAKLLRVTLPSTCRR